VTICVITEFQAIISWKNTLQDVKCHTLWNYYVTNYCRYMDSVEE
jgi:hypothetical protein